METMSLSEFHARGYSFKKNRGSKYHNKKTEYNGFLYDSAREAAYAKQLDDRTRVVDIADRVSSWERQVPFVLQPAFVDAAGTKHRAITYYADFVVHYTNGTTEIVDVKSEATKTDVYNMKKKMMLYVHGIHIQEK